VILSENPETESGPVTVTDKELFTKLWSEPRIIFKFINDNQFDKYTHILLILAAISHGFGQASTKNMGDKMSLPAVLAMSILAGGIYPC